MSAPATGQWLHTKPISSGWEEYERLVRSGVHSQVAAVLVLEQLDRHRRLTAPRLPREHGTERGWRQHRWDDTAVCSACRRAHADHNRGWRARTRPAPDWQQLAAG